MAKQKSKAAVHVVGQVQMRQRGARGIWHVRYSTPVGRREQSLKVTNMRVAMRKAREIDEMLERGEYGTLETRHKSKGKTFGEFMDEFKANYTNWKESTWRGNWAMLNKLKEEFGELPLGSVTTKLIESYLARKMDQEGVATATANRYLAALRTMFKMAMRWGYLGYNPAAAIKSKKEDNEIPDALTDEQLEHMLAELPGYARAIATFAAETGMRRSEMVQLLWSDIRFGEKMISVRGAGAKNSKFRMIPMTNRVYDLLQDLHEKNQKASTKRLQVLDWKDIKKSLHTAGVKAGVDHVHLHMLRHTFGTRLRDRGVPLDRIMELLGHRSMDMVLRYAKARPLQLKEAIDALNQ